MMFTFTKAIVRKPCPNMVHGITEAELGVPDYHKALVQHACYTDTLRGLGLQVEVLEADNRFPDSVFVEDVAVCAGGFALITRPGADSRRDETKLIENIIHPHFKHVEYIKENGTLEGGDVMMIGDHFFIGISGRTNHAGADQFIDVLKAYGKDGTKVPLNEMLHLKTGVSYLEHNNLLVTGEFRDHPALEHFSQTVVENEEAYAACSLWINDTVIVPAGYPSTKKKIKNLGYETVEAEMSEFQKLDGGLSCLSLRF